MWIPCSDSLESQQCPLQILWCPRRTVCCLQLFQVRFPKFCFITNCAWSVCETLCKNIFADLLPFHWHVILKCFLWRENFHMWCPNCKYNSLKKQGHLSTPVCICALVGRAVWSTSQAGGGPAHEVPAGWKEQITKSRVRWRKNVSIYQTWPQKSMLDSLISWILWSYLVHGTR